MKRKVFQVSLNDKEQQDLKEFAKILGYNSLKSVGNQSLLFKQALSWALAHFRLFQQLFPHFVLLQKSLDNPPKNAIKDIIYKKEGDSIKNNEKEQDKI